MQTRVHCASEFQGQGKTSTYIQSSTMAVCASQLYIATQLPCTKVSVKLAVLCLHQSVIKTRWFFDLPATPCWPDMLLLQQTIRALIVSMHAIPDNKCQIPDNKCQIHCCEVATQRLQHVCIGCVAVSTWGVVFSARFLTAVLTLPVPCFVPVLDAGRVFTSNCKHILM